MCLLCLKWLSFKNIFVMLGKVLIKFQQLQCISAQGETLLSVAHQELFKKDKIKSFIIEKDKMLRRIAKELLQMSCSETNLVLLGI